MDVKTTFLHGDLEEEIYMKQPEGFAVKGKKEMDSKSVKVPIPIGVRLSVEQCPKTQEEEEDMSRVPYASAIDSLMYAMVCTIPYIAHAVGVLSKFMSKPGKEHLTTVKRVFRYLCGTSDHGLCYQGRPGLDRVLDMRGFVDADWARDIDKRRSSGIINYRGKIHGSHSCKQGSSLVAEIVFKYGCPKTQEEEEDMSRVPYASAVGSLMYAMVCTRPDIAHAVGVLSRFMSKPGKEHWTAVKRVFRYLRGTSDYGLCYQGRPGLDRVLHIRSFVDADWAGDLDQRRSTSGYVFNLFGGAVSWMSKKQSVVALSTTKTEYMAATHASKEAVWL
eukprot:PITA_32794